MPLEPGEDKSDGSYPAPKFLSSLCVWCPTSASKEKKLSWLPWPHEGGLVSRAGTSNLSSQGKHTSALVQEPSIGANAGNFLAFPGFPEAAVQSRGEPEQSPLLTPVPEACLCQVQEAAPAVWGTEGDRRFLHPVSLAAQAARLAKSTLANTRVTDATVRWLSHPVFVTLKVKIQRHPLHGRVTES